MYFGSTYYERYRVPSRNCNANPILAKGTRYLNSYTLRLNYPNGCSTVILAGMV
jgi:hypothetical protein